MASLGNTSKAMAGKGLNPGQLLLGVNCEARGHLPAVLQGELGERVWLCPMAQELMSLESALSQCRGGMASSTPP